MDAAFRAEHGYDPSAKATDPAERPLGGWLAGQRRAARAARLKPERARRLSQIDPD